MQTVITTKIFRWLFNPASDEMVFCASDKNGHNKRKDNIERISREIDLFMQ
jgi:hypothetical protein